MASLSAGPNPPADVATIPALCEHLVHLHASRDAVVDTYGSMSFAELDRRAGKLARALLAAGVTKGARIGILMPNGADYLTALFGALRIGAVGVLISTLSRPPELAHLVRVADVDILLSADRYLRNDYVTILEQALPHLGSSDCADRLSLEHAPFLREIWIWGETRPRWARSGPDLVEGPTTRPGVDERLLIAAQGEVVPSDPALIMFTSGSSAEPKAVVHSQSNLVRQSLALADLMGGCGPGDRLLTTMPFFWVGGLCTVVMAALCSGTAVLCPGDSSMEATVACLRDLRATHIMHWPQQLDLMKDDPEFRALLARMRPAYAHQYEFFGLASPELNANTLGMTETLGPHSMMPIGPLPVDKPGSFGLAVGGIVRRIVDPETGEVLPPGAFGQLCLRGGALMTGIHRKAYTEVFDPNGFYRTDDIAMIDQGGHLFFGGRGGDIVKISGANVSPIEVEGVMRTLTGIKAVCVLGVPLDDHGETLVAAVVPEGGAQLDAEELRATLKQRLSSYKVPRHFLFLREEELPMTATAKIFKPRLRQLIAERLRPPAQK